MLETNAAQYVRENEYASVLHLKQELQLFAVAMREAGVMKSDSLSNELIKFHESFLRGLLRQFEKEVVSALEAETYSEIALNSIIDFDKYVDSYSITLAKPIYDYPNRLPYSHMVCAINEEVREVLVADAEYW